MASLFGETWNFNDRAPEAQGNTPARRSETGGTGEKTWESNLSTSCLSRTSRVSRSKVSGVGGFFQASI